MESDGSCITRFGNRLLRRKHLDPSTVADTKLDRCLTTLDLTALGIGATLGAGIYVVAGQVAREVAGPAVVLSFLIAAVASVLAGVCYAEFGARVPKTGSAYVYSYVTVGELWAFIIGWNLILEYVIGTASVARAWSSYVDSLVEHKISDFFKAHVHIGGGGTFSDYPDFFALSITLLLTVVLSVGVKESSILNNMFTAVNLLVVAYVVICGLFKIDFANWNIPADEVPVSRDPKYPNGDGGFFPFGVGGMLSGAATCFYAFVGFDCIATTGEEVKNPQKAIPIAIVVSLLACFFAYFGISAVLTLMVPYYSIDHDAPVPEVFHAVGWGVARYVIAVGAICGLSTSLLGGMFPMPRVIYAMASDGLIFRFLAYVNDRFKTPLTATVTAGVMAAVMAMMFDLKELVDMMSIGTLLAYTLVAASVLVLRYKVQPFSGGVTLLKSDGKSDGDSVNLAKQTDSEDSLDSNEIGYDGAINNSESSRLFPERGSSIWNTIKEALNPSNPHPTTGSESVVKIAVIFMGCMMIGCSAVLAYAVQYIQDVAWWALTILTLTALAILLCVVIIWRQPQNTNFITFKVPLVPLVSSVSMFVNIYLMMKLPAATWARFGIWMAIGLLIYFLYGMSHSSEEHRDVVTPDETDKPEDNIPSEVPHNTSIQ